MRRRHYILLEVAVGCVLVALCAFPLVSGPMRMLAREREMCVQAELERIAECAYVQVYTDLCAQKFSWESLNREISFEKIKICVGGGLEYDQRCFLQMRRSKMGKDGWEHKLIDIIERIVTGKQIGRAHV